MPGGGFAVAMAKFRTPDVPPPGAGLKTVTSAVPALSRSEAGIAASRVIALKKVVGRLAPFHRTTEFRMKFVPDTVRVNAVPPAGLELGTSAVIVGAGAVTSNGFP